MQLHRRPVVLPLPQHAHSLTQPLDSRRTQHNRHTPITAHCADSPHLVFGDRKTQDMQAQRVVREARHAPYADSVSARIVSTA